MLCANCNDETPKDDYLCSKCRVDLDPQEWDDRARVSTSVGAYLKHRGNLYAGYELYFPQDSPWAWLRILDEPSLSDPTKIVARDYISSQAIAMEYLDRIQLPMLIVWKATGDIYQMENFNRANLGPVDDEPIWTWNDKA